MCVRAAPLGAGAWCACVLPRLEQRRIFLQAWCTNQSLDWLVVSRDTGWCLETPFRSSHFARLSQPARIRHAAAPAGTQHALGQMGMKRFMEKMAARVHLCVCEGVGPCNRRSLRRGRRGQHTS